MIVQGRRKSSDSILHLLWGESKLCCEDRAIFKIELAWCWNARFMVVCNLCLELSHGVYFRDGASLVLLLIHLSQLIFTGERSLICLKILTVIQSTGMYS